MAMDLTRVRRTLAFYAKQLRSPQHSGLGGSPTPKEMPHLRVNGIAVAMGFVQGHLLSMIERTDDLINDERDRREKIMRWFGFVQGACWVLGMFTVDELKAHSNPENEPPS
jgi:hypothetical protein